MFNFKLKIMKNINKKDINYMGTDKLIDNLRHKDNRYKKISRSFQILFYIFIFLYAALFLFNPDSELTLNHRIAGGCYVIAFTLFALYFRKYYNKYKTVNYFDPVKKVLKEAEQRYRLWRNDLLMIIFSLFFIDIATVLMEMKYFAGSLTNLQAIVVIQVIYLLLILIAIVVGYYIWKKESRPIWLSAKNLLKELDE